MAHGTTLNTGSGGDLIADFDLAAGGTFPTTGKVQCVSLFSSPANGTTPTPYLLGQKTMANSFGVVIASDQAPLPTTHAQSGVSTASWTSATANNTALTLAVGNYGSVLIAFNPTGSITAGQINFEVDPGDGNWYTLQVQRLSSFAAETNYLLTGGAQVWSADIGGAANVRVRLNPQITGTGTAAVALVATAAPDPMPVVGIAGLSDTVPNHYAVFDRIVPGANKYMATLFNTSASRKAVVTNVWALNWQNASGSGVLLEQYLARITARTAGTVVTVHAKDTNDTLSTGISADTNSTAVTEDHIIQRFWHTNAQMLLASTGLTLGLASDTAYQEIWHRDPGQRGLVLRQNQGITIRNVTSSTVLSCSYLVEFFDLPA